MQKNNSNNYIQEDGVNVKELLNLLTNSIKLIIIITLIITTVGAIYSFQKAHVYKTTALIEIGSYLILDSKSDTYQITLIEPLSTLKNTININFIHKLKLVLIPKDFQIDFFEGRLLRINYESPSPENNEELLNKIITFIENRHLNMQTNNAKRIENQFYKLNIVQQDEDLEFQLKLMELEFLMNQNLPSTQLIGEIVTKEVSKKTLTILLSFILGLLLSFVTIFINNSLKALKEE